TGSDFSAYKKSTIRRRIERRMHVHGMSSPDEYAQFLEHTAYEIDALFRELLISVTSFFRDEQAFQVLEHELTKLVELKTDTQPLRAWIAGCATGEEAYSVAIVFKEVLQRSGKELKIQLFATDLDQQAVDVARTARYPEGIAADVSPERLKRFFTREDTGYRVNKDVREVIIFAVQNAIKDPPFTKLDLVSCRNLLIYLESSLQKRVLSLFSYSLRAGGLLLLGTSESVSGFDDRFLALDKRWKLFQRLSNASSQSLPDFFHDRPPPLGGETHAATRDGQRGVHGISSAAERVLLSSFVPPTVLVSERGEIIYVQGRIGMFFEPAQGEATQNVFSMAREGLRAELPAAVRKAASSTNPVVRSGLLVKTNGSYSAVTLTVRRLTEPAALRGSFLISFEIAQKEEESPKKASKKARVQLARAHHCAGRRAAAHARKPAGHDRGARDFQRGAQEHERRAAEHERGATEHERRARDLARRDAIAERRAADREHRAGRAQPCALAGQRRYAEPLEQHRSRDGVLR
ncbi:MAG TPA: protein-glutamate O-methyltransferase CheR, partial [Polyangiales bacterium]|nr:protein-glutamate O-methyltransferase CheR [Polyangiales bacterium]